MEKLLCPSMMCADFGYLKDSVVTLDQSGVDIFHCDIMDGAFVPNITMGVLDIKAIRSHTDKMIDCHLMIENPASSIDLFLEAGVDLIYIHPEAERYTGKTLTYIRSKGAAAGLAVNPDTSVEMITELLPMTDYLMVMTVNPGFAGQKFIDSTRNKIKRLVKLKSQFNYKIMIDGACSPEVIKELSDLGCDGFVLGTSALFGKERPYADILNELRAL